MSAPDRFAVVEEPGFDSGVAAVGRTERSGLTGSTSWTALDSALVDAWQEMADLRATAPAHTRPVACPALSTAHRIARSALFAPGAGGQRRVPSAGAIFPYTVLVVIWESRAGGDGRWSIFELAADGSVHELAVDPVDVETIATSLDSGSVAESRCYLLLLARPWLSVRKYGLRGYLYCRLDAGHALTNLLGLALTETSARIQLGGYVGAAARVLGQQMPYRELIGAVVLDDCSTTGDGAEPIRVSEPRPPVRAAETLEAGCWAMLGRLRGPGQQRSSPVTDCALFKTSSTAGSVRDRWVELSARRRSARDFGDQAITDSQLLNTVAALGTSLPINLGAATPVELTVVVTDPRLATAASAAGLRVLAATAGPDDLVAACMAQQHVRLTCAFLLLHGPRQLLLAADRIGFEDSIFRAAAGGQLLYLGATRAGVAATTIGSFDARRWAEFAELSADVEPLYLMAIGSAATPAAPKLDRREAALVHGEH